MQQPDLELLIADDDPTIRDLCARAFRDEFRVVLAKDGAEAIAMLRASRPAAILVDEMMPGAPGSEVLRLAKEQMPEVPRLLMTASADPAAAMSAVNHGEIHRFYTKPLKLMEVKRAILDLVARARADEALRVELQTLRTQKLKTSSTRVALLSDGESGDRVESAGARRGFLVHRAKGVSDLERVVGAGGIDVVVVDTRIGEPGVREVARLANNVDEATALVLVDVASGGLGGLGLAFSIGATDCLTPPWPDEVLLSVRLERAAARPREKRELRRLTFDLVVANRDLHLANVRVEAGQMKLLNSLMTSLEARDPYTAGHTDRVAGIAVRTGEVLGMKPATLAVVRVGALLHDLGKIGIRDEVLYKPGRLTPDEFEIIKTHTTIGARILDGIESLACALPIVRGHHEKLDGTGYPDQQKAGDIPLEVRVVSVADVVDAITSTRPYRPGSTADEAFAIIAPMTGPHLDPVVVDALKGLHKEGRLEELLQARA
jgi:putative nucleotidyltransferase with HDIG domain